MNNSKSLYYIFIIIAAAVMYSCANIGNPSGGPIDKTPPIFMRSNPTPNAVNVKDRKIEIFFDEIVTLKDPSTKSSCRRRKRRCHACRLSDAR